MSDPADLPLCPLSENEAVTKPAAAAFGEPAAALRPLSIYWKTPEAIRLVLDTRPIVNIPCVKKTSAARNSPAQTGSLKRTTRSAGRTPVPPTPGRNWWEYGIAY